MIPLLSKLKKDSRTNSKQQVITQVLNCLGAGVLLGLALLDILPELRESISSISSEKDIHYPLGNDFHSLTSKSTRTRYTAVYHLHSKHRVVSLRSLNYESFALPCDLSEWLPKSLCGFHLGANSESPEGFNHSF